MKDKDFKQEKPFIPFSKRVVLSSKYESYVLSLILIIMVWLEKDVSAIAVLLSLSWGGYRILQNYYIWLAKHEHVYELQLRYKQAELDAGRLGDEITELENQDLESEDF